MAGAQSFRRTDRSVRLSFHLQGSTVTLVDRRLLDMVPLPSIDLEPRDPHERSGFWVEVQDRDGVPRYRLAMRHPTIRRTEVVRDDGSFSTLPWVAPGGAFSVVVPDAGDGAELVVYGSPPNAPTITTPAVELGRVPIRQPRTPGTD